MLHHRAGQSNLASQDDAESIQSSAHLSQGIKLRQKKRLSAQGMGRQPIDYHVLVVHHSKSTLEMITALFRKCGYYVTTACNNDEALISLGQNNFDLVFSDIDTPLFDGYHLAYMIQKYSLSTKIAVMTGRCQAEISDLMTEGAIDGWLFKPFKLKAFKELLKKMGLEPEALYRQSKS